MTAPSLDDYRAYAEKRNREQPAGLPTASIVTVTLNAARSITRTIDSVQMQGPAVEQVFVDGGSKDGTADIVRARMRPEDYFLTERDAGISDAFNKGVALARGRFIQVVNADDWLSPGQVELSLTLLVDSGADFVFGDVRFYEDGRPIFTYRGEPDYAGVIQARMPAIAHTTVLARRACFERAGLFDLAYRNAMDYDWLLRIHRAGLRGVHSPSIVGHMTHAGVSNRQFRRTIDEVRRIAIAHGREPWRATLEAQGRLLKTSLAQPIRRHARPLYERIRRRLNPSYDPTLDNQPRADAG